MFSPQSNWRSEVSQLPRAAWILFGGTLVNRFGSFIIVFLVLYLTQKGFSAPQAGLAASTYGVGAVFASIIGGYLADHLGRRNSIALSMFLSAGVMLALSQADSLGWILSLSAAAGFSAELYRPASLALLTDLTPAGGRVTAFAFYRLAINMGFAAGPAIGGLLAERSFFYLFLGDAITSTVFGVIALTALPYDRPLREHGGRHDTGTVKEMLTDWPFIRFIGAGVLSAFVYLQLFTTFSLQIRAFGFSDAAYGMLISVNGIVVMLLELPLSFVTRRFSPKPVIALGLLLVAVGFGVLGYISTLVWIVVAVMIITLGEILMMPVASAYVADISPDNMRGRYQGLWSSSFGVGMVLGPGLGAAFFSVNPTGLWTTCFALGAIAAMLVLVSPRHKRS